MYKMDELSNPNYYIIYKDGQEFLKISKKNNNIDVIKKYFNIK